MSKKARLWIFSTILVLVVIVALQNTESVSTRILFATVTLPRALLILVATAAGFFAGMFVAVRGARAKRLAE